MLTLLTIIFLIWLLVKIFKFIGKRILLFIILLIIAYFAMSQTQDTSKILINKTNTIILKK